MPSWQSTSVDVSASLKGSARIQTASRPRQRLGRALLVAQVALCLLLLTGAGLLVRSLTHLHGVAPGFRTQNVLIMGVHMEDLERITGKPDFAVEQKRLPGQYRALETRLNALPGVRSASISWLGLFGGNDLYLDVSDAGAAGEKRPAHVDYVSSRYFETVGMQVALGRAFDQRDSERSCKSGDDQ